MSWTHQLITASRIDNFIKYKKGYKYNFGDNYEEYSTQDFIDNLLKIEDPAKFYKANAGSSVHKLIEYSKYNIPFKSSYLIDDWTINIDKELNVALEYPLVREAFVSGNIAGVNICSRVDSIDAIAVHDLKTTSTVNLENYINSFQWKVYLILSGLNKFIYDVFKVKVEENPNTVTIQEYHKLELYAYEGMRQEVEEVIAQYNNVLLRLEPLFVARINEYNKQIENLINVLDEHKLLLPSSILEINKSIELLSKKYIAVKDLTV